MEHATASRHSLRTILPAVVMVASVATALGAGYYFAIGSASGLPTVTWSVNPLVLTFSVQVGSVSALDTFTCSAPVHPVTLEAFSSQPDIITLTVSPSAISGCGPSPVQVVVTAACTATALESDTCPGNYSGTVLVCGPTSYTCLQSALAVSITVVSEDLMDKSFTLLSPALPAGQTFVPLNTKITWKVNYTIVNTFSTGIKSVVLSDHFAASLAVDTSTLSFSAPCAPACVPSFTTSLGRQPQWRFTWSIGTLLPGQTATLAVNVFTTMNPSGQQDFTQPGLQILNSGATLKWIPPGLPMQSFTTLPVFVMAGNTVGAVVGIVTSAGTAAGSITVTLSSGGATVATTSTSTVGFYDFGTLASGTYTISATTSTGTATATVTATAGAITTQNLST